MTEALKIIYAHFIPDELISDFAFELGKVCNADIQVVKDMREHENFTGPEFTDIIVYVERHLSDIIIGGVHSNSAYSIFKYSLSKLWNSFRSWAASNNTDEEGNNAAITLDIKDNDRNVEITLQGNIKEAELENVVDKLFEFLNSDKLPEAYKHPDNLQASNDKPKIRLVFNEESKTWEPLNFGDLRRRFNELRNWAGQNIND